MKYTDELYRANSSRMVRVITAHDHVEKLLGFPHYLRKCHIKIAQDADRINSTILGDLHHLLCPLYAVYGFNCEGSYIGKCTSMIYDACYSQLMSQGMDLASDNLKLKYQVISEVCWYCPQLNSIKSNKKTQKCYRQDEDDVPALNIGSNIAMEDSALSLAPGSSSEVQKLSLALKSDLEAGCTLVTLILYAIAGLKFASITTHGSRASLSLLVQNGCNEGHYQRLYKFWKSLLFPDFQTEDVISKQEKFNHFCQVYVQDCKFNTMMHMVRVTIFCFDFI